MAPKAAVEANNVKSVYRKCRMIKVSFIVQLIIASFNNGSMLIFDFQAALLIQQKS
jgi:hypothetical protein